MRKPVNLESTARWPAVPPGVRRCAPPRLPGVTAVTLAVALLAGVATAGTAAAPPARPPAASAVVQRELHVPFDELDLLLEKSPRRVFLTREAYTKLLERSRRETEAAPLESILPVSGEYDIVLSQDRARLSGTVLIDVLDKGLQALPVGIGNVSLLSATLDDKPASMGRDDRGGVLLFVEGKGRHSLELDAVAPVDTTAAQQVLSFELPSPATSRLHLTAPGDVEIRGGAAVISRAYDAAAGETRFELLAERGAVTLTLSLNSRLKRSERVVVARSVLVDEITQAVERLHAAVSLDIQHRAVDDIRFRLPTRFEVREVSSPQLARWAIDEDADGHVLTVTLRKETTGRVLLNISAVSPAYSPGEPWSWPALVPLDVAGHAAVVGVLLEQGLQPVDVSSRGLIAVDGSVLASALPASVFQTEPGAARTRLVLSYYAPCAPFELRARFTKARRGLDVTTNLLLTFGDAAVELQGGFAMIPRAEPLFDFDFMAPNGWDVVSVTDTQRQAIAFERYPAGAAGTRIHVRLPRGVAPQQERRVHIAARRVPPGWLGPWDEQIVPLPAFAVEGASRDVGAVAVAMAADMRVQATRLEGLSPLDANEKALYGLTGSGAELAYRYDSRPYAADLRVTRIPARLTAETYSFFRVGRDALDVHVEVVYAVEQAKVRQVALTLPTNTPKALSIRGLRGTVVKETVAEEGESGRRWTALLSEARGDDVHLALDFQFPLAGEAGTNTALPLARAEDVAYQSGFVSVEGNAELDVRVVRHPRKVDIGELAGAEYLPGRRLLGVYGFVGDPPSVDIAVDERAGYPLPPALVQRAQLETTLSAQGLSQTAARFHINSGAVYVDIRLPEKSTLWSVLLDGSPVKPQREGDSLLLDLRAGQAPSRELTVVYETPVVPLAFWRTVTVPAPRLRLHGHDGGAVRDVPVADMSWSLYPPGGYRVLDAGGSVATRSVRPERPAAAQLAEFLYHAAGGIGFGRGLIGGCASPITQVRSRAVMARKMGEAQYVDADDIMDEESLSRGVKDSIPMPATVQPSDEPPPRPSSDEAQRRKIIEKMERIKIPEIEFREANIYDVVSFLSQASVEYDTKTTPGEKKGVDIILNLGISGVAPAQAEPTDPFAEVPDGRQTSRGVPTITFHARYISLREALRIVTVSAGLKWSVRGSVVMVVPLNAPDEDLVVRMYDVAPEVEKRMRDRGAVQPPRQRDTGGDFIALDSSETTRGEAYDWKDFFETMGVQFPQGSSVRYVPGADKLIVANTPENIDSVEQTLESIGAATSDRGGGEGGEHAALESKPATWGFPIKPPPSSPFSGLSLLSPAAKWAAQGARSLNIDLTTDGRALNFTSLGVDPELRLTLVNVRRFDALAAVFALATFLWGCLLTVSRPGRKAAYVASVLMLATALPALPVLSQLAAVFNAAFYAACLLVPYYWIAALVRRARGHVRSGSARRGRRGSPATASTAALLLVCACVGTLAFGSSARASEAESHPPVDVPADAIVVPYADAMPFDGERVLVPYDRYTNLWRKAFPAAVTNPPPASFGLGPATYAGRLEDGDALSLTGRMTVDVYTDGLVAIPFVVGGGVLTSATLDDAPAHIGAPPAGHANSASRRQIPAQQQMLVLPSPQQQESRTDSSVAAAAANTLYVTGKGRHALTFACRLAVTRNGGWRAVDGYLPAPPAAVVRLVVPEARTEVVVERVADRRLHRTQVAEETVDVPLGSAGRISLQWRPRVGEGDIDRTLTAESRGILDVREDCLTLTWQLDFRFRRGEREVLDVRLPAGYLVGEVLGANVRGWSTPDADLRRLSVALLKQAKERESITLKLWQPVGAAGTGSTNIAVPFVEVPGASRQTGNVLIRRSLMLDVQTASVANATRTELDEENLRGLLAAVAADSPLGIRAYQAYSFTALPLAIDLAVTPTSARVSAHAQVLLRIAERERMLESRVVLDVSRRPVHVARIRIPDALTLDHVAAPGAFEWVEERIGGERMVTIRFRAGLEGSIPILIRGRLGGGEAAERVELPRLAVSDVDEQTGDIVVQTDPAFDVRADELRGIEPILLKRVYAWLTEDQRPLARLALHYRTTDYGGTLRLLPRKPDLSCYTLTNVRVTDRAVEETVLLHYTIRNAGVRELLFDVPEHLAAAKIHVPLLRRKEVTPVEGTSGWRRVRLLLQDEVMNEVKVLIEHDRVLSRDEQLVQLPVVRDARVARQYLAYENAGRDEVVVDELIGLEPIGRQQKEWSTVATLLHGGTTRAFAARQDKGAPLLRFHTRQREAVSTAGAGIGFAKTILVLDGQGAYRAQQIYQVDNRTEPYLTIQLPPDAELWTARVADEYVKPVTPDAATPSRVRIPLVKTAAGDLDYAVTLTYGGKLPPLRNLRDINFPLVRTENIQVELSQVELRLPNEFDWVHFDGTMREETQTGAFEAGYLEYRNKVAKRLVQTLKFGNVFEQARAVSNLRNLEQAIQADQNGYGLVPGNEKLTREISNARAIFDDAGRQIEGAAQVQLDVTDNRASLNEAFDGQNNALARNVVLNTAPNWSAPSSQTEARTQTLFNGIWLANGLLTNNVAVTASANSAVIVPLGTVREKQAADSPRKEVAFGKGEAQGKLFKGLQAAAGFSVDEQRQQQAAQQPPPRRNAVHRGQKALADEYQRRLEEQSVQQLQEQQYLRQAGAQDAAYQVEVDHLLAPASEAPALGGMTGGRQLQRTGAAAAGVPAAPEATGLRSLEVALPDADPTRWTVHRFTTPRGDVSLSARAVSDRTIDGLKRVGTVLVGLILLVFFRRAAMRGLGATAKRRLGTALILLGVIALLLGCLPLAAVLAVIAGIVLRVSAKRARPPRRHAAEPREEE